MTTISPSLSAAPTPLDRWQIEQRLGGCPRLPSLRSVNGALRDLLGADQRYTQQISEVIRRDPSLTARLLRMVNSVYYNLNNPVTSLEEAVFYLGLQQIRQLVMVTPIVEDFHKLVGGTQFPWRAFWQHCIATAILTREVAATVEAPQDESAYLAGLIHDVGKIVMASAFPQHFEFIYRQNHDAREDLIALERSVLGMDHAELGAMYLQTHTLPDIYIEVARYHHEPERAGRYAKTIAAVQIADLLARHDSIGNSGSGEKVTEEVLMNASGWKILFPRESEQEKSMARAALRRSVERLPAVLEGLV